MQKSNELKNKLTLIVLGRSGSGKGTQAEFILRRLKREGVRHFETGRFLRALMKKSNPTVWIARQVMKNGLLFPAWFAAYTWLKELIEKGNADKHLVYDGAPRRVWEAELVDEVMRWHGRPEAVCVYIEVSAKEATKRLLLRSRADDNLKAIRNRMQFFSRDVLPVIHYFKLHGRLVQVDGNKSVAEVWQEIDRALGRKLGKKWPRK